MNVEPSSLVVQTIALLRSALVLLEEAQMDLPAARLQHIIDALATGTAADQGAAILWPPAADKQTSAAEAPVCQKPDRR